MNEHYDETKSTCGVCKVRGANSWQTGQGKWEAAHRLPNFALKSIQDSIPVFYVLLRLFPHVEDRTITTSAQNIL